MSTRAVGTDLSVTERRAIVEERIRECSRAVYSLTIDNEASEITGDAKAQERITKQLGEVLKKRKAYEQILKEIPEESSEEAAA